MLLFNESIFSLTCIAPFITSPEITQTRWIDDVKWRMSIEKINIEIPQAFVFCVYYEQHQGESNRVWWEREFFVKFQENTFLNVKIKSIYNNNHNKETEGNMIRYETSKMYRKKFSFILLVLFVKIKLIGLLK